MLTETVKSAETWAMTATRLSVKLNCPKPKLDSNSGGEWWNEERAGQCDLEKDGMIDVTPNSRCGGGEWDDIDRFRETSSGAGRRMDSHSDDRDDSGGNMRKRKQDWARFDCIMVSNFVIAIQAQIVHERLVQGAAENYKIGTNSGNIIVQNRMTDLEEEKTQVYARTRYSPAMQGELTPHSQWSIGLWTLELRRLAYPLKVRGCSSPQTAQVALGQAGHQVLFS
ncbi:hypothetical protein EDB89DRAFT_55055 [Lactarius sanguifluus]|nr:hypothetical protein EDB89DRAFT_55055 [Lactarius sanguifluus]